MIAPAARNVVSGSSVDEAFAYCADVTKAHYENFPVASVFLPEEKRPYIQAIYAFSRAADDMADELDLPAQRRLDALNDWENQLHECYTGQARHPVFIALRETVRNLDIPKEPLLDLLAAFKRDVVQNRYETFDDVLSYCRCSANPVGRLVLMIFGYREETLVQLSDHICTALQLTNFWQDVAVDRKKNRLYIPLEDCRTFGYSLEFWDTETADASFRKLMKFQVDRTRDLFYAGARLPSLVERELQLELKLVWFGGMAVLRKLEKIKFDLFHRRPTLTTFNKVMILFRGLVRNNLERFGKKKEAWDLQ